MRIASRAVRFVRLDLRASLRPRFVRLVPPGASLPRAAAAQVVVPSMPRARAPGVFAASLASRWVRRIPAAPVVAGVRTFAAALVYPSRWRPPSSSPLSAIVLFDCCVAAVVGEAPRCTCRRSLVPLAPRRPRLPVALCSVARGRRPSPPDDPAPPFVHRFVSGRAAAPLEGVGCPDSERKLTSLLPKTAPSRRPRIASELA